MCVCIYAHVSFKLIYTFLRSNYDTCKLSRLASLGLVKQPV